MTRSYSDSTLDALRNLGRSLIQSDEERREYARRATKAAEAEALVRVSRDASKAVLTLLGEDVAASLGPWRRYSGNACVAAIGEPDDSGIGPYYEGDAPGQDGELRYYGDRKELWYRPRMSNQSARIRDREHFARMIVAHSIYG